ncbi:MAG: class B sortase, partial [Clostridia bacterium]
IIYAHNMRTGAMFAALKGYLGEAFRAAHPLIRYDTLAARGEYRVFAVLELDSASRDDPCYQPIDTRDPEALAALRKALVARHAIIIPEAFPAPGAALLTLSTCDQVASPARLVIMAAEAGGEGERGGGGNQEAGRVIKGGRRGGGGGNWEAGRLYRGRASGGGGGGGGAAPPPAGRGGGRPGA